MLDSEEVLERIVQWFKTGKGRPFMLELRPTNLCNLHCPSCLARGYPVYTPGEELSAAEYERIIDEAAELGVRYVQIVGGGEPFIRREKVLRIMRRVKGHGMVGFVVTNGTLFDRALIQEIFDLRWDAIFFSLDGPDPKLNDFLRSQEGCFEKTTSAIRSFAEKKAEAGSRFPRLDIGPTLTHYNCRRIVDLVRLGATLGVDNVVFQPVSIRPGLGGEDHLLTAKDREALAREIPVALRIARESGISTNLEDLDAVMIEKSNELPIVIRAYSATVSHPWLSIHCFSPWFYIGINPDGAVGPCSINHESTYVENIRGTSLKDWWEGRHFRRFREGLMRGELPEACVNCSGTTVLEIQRVRNRLRKVVQG